MAAVAVCDSAWASAATSASPRPEPGAVRARVPVTPQALMDFAQFVGMEWRTKRLLLSRFLQKDHHRSQLQREVHPPRTLTPVKFVSQS
ncbi:uncharacterized protein LOC101707932 isoform X3 [Heterocephalus glaber]|uniref:Uncharacterized protein LOC101707932 isoform X3 n=1 Tax=Heterocephalus glaber TaxID=10181 RepID=A0AAX6RZE6_HETGA|nr:uncharacterized protein LOC101707932 isoform X3 [Heterocephalus glaber]